jgi:hypothetical protein
MLAIDGRFSRERTMDQRISFPNTPLTLASAKSGAKRIRGKLTIGIQVKYRKGWD